MNCLITKTLFLTTVFLATSCGTNTPKVPHNPAGVGTDSVINGSVIGGGLPIAGATVSLLITDTDNHSYSIGETVTNSAGEFSIPFSVNAQSQTVFYLMALGGSVSGGVEQPTLALMTALGAGDSVFDTAIINEVTTVATVWAYAQLLDDRLDIQGNDTGKYNAAFNVRNFVDVETGDYADVLLNSNNAGRTTTVLARFNTLANILTECITATTTAPCEAILSAAHVSGKAQPTNTASAFSMIARNPWHNPDGIFNLLPTIAYDERYHYMPVLNVAPSAWTLALLFSGGGAYAMGNAAIDSAGNFWGNNNFILGAIGSGTCANLHTVGIGMTKLSPQGQPLSPSFGFEGGGVSGPGFGIVRNQADEIWIGNFGTQSVSHMANDGTPLSPDTGYAAGGAVQGMHIDANNDLWFAVEADNRDASSQDSLNVYRNQDPSQARRFTWAGAEVLNRPFGLTTTTIQTSPPEQLVWVVNQDGQSVSAFNDDGEHVYTTPLDCCGMRGPRGIAADSSGNLWIPNFGEDGTGLNGGGVTALMNNGFNYPGSPFMAGTVAPWGVAVDGADNIWVADFNGRGLVNLCGTNTANCPQGFSTGDPISPTRPDDDPLMPNGYHGGYATQSLIAGVIDQAGNVWVTNNIDLRIPGALTAVQDAPECTTANPNYGGQGVVVFYGIAAPVEIN